jgi:ubiquinone/menaquinone biosynthesis C-methylase UbiE
MTSVSCFQAADVSYWDGYSRWYRLWFEHNNYHDNILRTLIEMARPRWKVLDIGAGNGVLSLPLCAIGCDVTALEPSSGMRGLLERETSLRGIDRIRIDHRRWEDFSGSPASFDLIMACNSLHLTALGLRDSLQKIAGLRPVNIFVVSEQEFCTHSNLLNDPVYSMVLAKQIPTESSFAYHSVSEAIEHWSYMRRRYPASHEERDIRSQLICTHDHFWIRDMATVNIYWWTRNDHSVA